MTDEAGHAIGGRRGGTPATQKPRDEGGTRSDRLLHEPGPLLSNFDSMSETAASSRLSTSVGG